MAGDHMRNGFDPETQYAALGERVEGQGRRLTNLESTVNQGFRQVETSIAGLSNEFRSSQRPQWQAMSVLLAFALAIGGLVYWPIQKATNDLKTAITSLSEKAVTREELEWRSSRAAEDRTRTEMTLRSLDANLVPRAEHSRVWASYDQRFLDQQRQIDELKQYQGSVYGARDALLDIRERIDRLEQRRSYSPPAPP